MVKSRRISVYQSAEIGYATMYAASRTYQHDLPGLSTSPLRSSSLIPFNLHHHHHHDLPHSDSTAKHSSCHVTLETPPRADPGHQRRSACLLAQQPPPHLPLAAPTALAIPHDPDHDREPSIRRPQAGNHSRAPPDRAPRARTRSRLAHLQ